MKKIIALFLCLILVGSVWSQSKKEVKKNKIKSATTWETKYEDGKPLTYKSSYQEYDRDGHCILNIEYSPTKVVLRKQTARYDANKNKIEETEFDLLKKKILAVQVNSTLLKIKPKKLNMITQELSCRK